MPHPHTTARNTENNGTALRTDAPEHNNRRMQRAADRCSLAHASSLAVPLAAAASVSRRTGSRATHSATSCGVMGASTRDASTLASSVLLAAAAIAMVHGTADEVSDSRRREVHEVRARARNFVDCENERQGKDKFCYVLGCCRVTHLPHMSAVPATPS